MAALHERWGFYCGDTWQMNGPLSYADGTPFDLSTGAALQWELKDDQGNVILLLELGAGITIADPSDVPPHQCTITVTPAQSALIAPGVYRDQLRAIDPAGLVSTQVVGTIEVRPSFFVSS